MKKENFIIADLLDEKHIALDVNASTVNAVLHYVAELFGPTHVHADFEKALSEREREYPTGLPTHPVGVALPHADPQLVIKAGLAIVVLRHPVMFSEMGNPDHEVMVRVVIGIALPEDLSDHQTTMLNWLLEKIQQPMWLQQVVSACSADEVLKLFR